jgi:CHAD domain-containing protein
MATYAIQDSESIGTGVRRLYTEMVAQAADHLSGEGDPDPVEAVHEARKELKKARAIARLVRDDFPQYRSANRLCRDAARHISDLRDASAMVETLDRLQERLEVRADPQGLDALKPVREAVVARRDRMHAEHAPGQMARALEGVRRAQAAASGFDLDAVGLDTLNRGLKRTYQRSVMRFFEARSSLTGRVADDAELTHVLHMWRKRVKYHRYHVDFLSGAWPVVFKARERAMHDLSDLLGEDHDLAVLRESLAGVLSENPDLAGPIDVVVGAGSALRGDLQRRARWVGERCCGESPQGLASRLIGAVGAWRAEVGNHPI